jgi:hypothetical protein
MRVARSGAAGSPPDVTYCLAFLRLGAEAVGPVNLEIDLHTRE